MLADRIAKFPSPGEINSHVVDAKTAIENIFNLYSPDALVVDKTYGISLEFEQWRFNVRMSNTEPVVRLNVESRGDKKLVDEKTKEILALLK
jgi:phosphomannomutase